MSAAAARLPDGVYATSRLLVMHQPVFRMPPAMPLIVSNVPRMSLSEGPSRRRRRSSST